VVKEKGGKSISRRTFMSDADSTAFAFSIVDSKVLGADAPSNKLNLAIIGASGQGAATSAIERTNNAFKDYHERMVSNGITPANVKHSVARKMVSTMSAMWKTGSEYDEKLL